MVETGVGVVADNGSWAVGVASGTGVLYGEADAEDPDVLVVGEAEAWGLGDAEGLDRGLGDGAVFFAPVGCAEADKSVLRADDALPARGSTNDFVFALLLLVADFVFALLLLVAVLLALLRPFLVAFVAGALPIRRSVVFLLADGADNRDDFWGVEDEGDGPAASAILLALVRLVVLVLFDSEAGGE